MLQNKDQNSARTKCEIVLQILMSVKSTHMTAAKMLLVRILKAALRARVKMDSKGTDATAQVSRFCPTLA